MAKKITNTADADALENLAVSACPGGIEAQEKRGQLELVASEQLPAKCDHDELLKRWGVELGDPEPSDPLFRPAKLPEGWTRKATEHDMHSVVVDEKGRERISVFYKAAFYDRRAQMRACSRFRIVERQVRGCWRMNVECDGVTLQTVPLADDSSESEAMARESCKGWLDANYPGWDDDVKSWEIEV